MKTTLLKLAGVTFALALVLSVAGSVSAQTTGTTDNSSAATTTTTNNTTDTSGTGATTDTSTPGLPDTGMGGDAAMNYAVLLSSGLIAVGATVLLARKLTA
jgi:hypothetical protein